MTLCLNMIVKDEAENILETLKNLVENVQFDYWVIHDTGSLDKTPELVENFFKGAGIPGELHLRKWVSFGDNRQAALEAAEGKTDYVLFFDADNRLNGKLPPLPEGQDGLLLTTRRGSTVYSTKAIVRNDGSYRWRGVVHEALYFQAGKERVQHLEGAYEILSQRLGARSRDSATYFRDAKILEAALDTLSEADQDLKARYTFYCANSWKDAGAPGQAAEYYRRRIEMGGWVEEIYISYVELGMALSKTNREEEALVAWRKGVELCPDRAECFYLLAQRSRLMGSMQFARLYAAEGMKLPMPAPSRLFLWGDVYRFWLKYEYLCALVALKRPKAEIEAGVQALRAAGAPAHLEKLALGQNAAP